MPLSPTGSRLGAYELVAPLGAGGMGEVYRAKDTKLGREVALKILPASFTNDPERLARFRREAQVLASLNHPHIGAIYGLEEVDGTQFLVLELVDGESLDKRIARSRIPVDEALSIAKQIAEALEAAHEKGIIHRDLKPANIALTHDGNIKVLDFGLAKAVEPTSGTVDAMNLPTITSPAMVTGAGVILGSAAYMAPEQARGKVVDRRVDIWAFGVVLFEMVTGRRAFPAEEISDTLASVLKDEPDWTSLPPDLPSSIPRLLRRCIERDPRRRLSAIGDARFDLDERDEIGAPRPTTSAVAWIGAATVALSVVALGWFAATSRASHLVVPVTRFSVLATEKMRLFRESTSVALSPDGRFIALASGQSLAGSGGLLWLRAIDSLDARPLEGTDGAFMPFWSPDSRQLAFFTGDHKLKKITLDTGHVEELCDAVDGRGGTWSSHAVILFAPGNQAALMRVPATGGTPQPATSLDTSRGEASHRFPMFLPDGEHFLYSVAPARAGAYDVYVASLAGPERDLILSAQTSPVFAESGYLLYVRKGGLVAQPYDPVRRTLSGPPISMTDNPGGLGDSFLAGYAVSASRTGTLAYLTRRPDNTSVVWFDQSGRQVGSVAVAAGRYFLVSLARSGRRAALARWTSPTESDLWLADLDRNSASRLTGTVGSVNGLVWSPDDRRVAFSNNPQGTRDIFVKSLGAASEEVLFASKVMVKDPQSWSPDGKFLLYREVDPATSWDLWALPLGHDRTPKPIARTSFNETVGAFSPDSRWIAYVSNETGRNEVYVQGFPTPGRRDRISTNGASGVWWRADGRQLMMANLDRTEIWTADFHIGSDFEADAPRLVGHLPTGVVALDATPDLKRLLALVDENSQLARSVTVVENWPAALR